MKNSRRCPKCSAALELQSLMGVKIDACVTCSGVWLDHGELEAVTRSRGGDALSVRVSKERRTENLCPVCKPAALLFEGRHSLGEDFLLDVCNSCGGLWFDPGEFPRLLRMKTPISDASPCKS